MGVNFYKSIFVIVLLIYTECSIASENDWRYRYSVSDKIDLDKNAVVLKYELLRYLDTDVGVVEWRKYYPELLYFSKIHHPKAFTVFFRIFKKYYHVKSNCSFFEVIPNDWYGQSVLLYFLTGGNDGLFEYFLEKQEVEIAVAMLAYMKLNKNWVVLSDYEVDKTMNKIINNDLDLKKLFDRSYEDFRKKESSCKN